MEDERGCGCAGEKWLNAEEWEELCGPDLEAFNYITDNSCMNESR